MLYHILNGDALAYSFPDAAIPGEIIVTREAFIDGDLSGENLPEFWQSRIRHHKVAEKDYYNNVVSEFERIIHVPADAVLNLWFEYDLFCQVNSWFVLSLIHALPVRPKVFAVHTTHVDKTSQQFWNAFGPASSNELNQCYLARILLSDTDLALGHSLWSAYKNHRLDELTILSKHQSASFPYLQEVVQAHVDRFPAEGRKGRPERVIEDIVTNLSTDFHSVFKEFYKRESIYGFGDTQVKAIYDKVIRYL